MDYEKIYEKNIIIARAINETRENKRSGSKCVAIYLYNKRIVSIGTNKDKTHPLVLKYNYPSTKYFFNEAMNKLYAINKGLQYPIHAELDGYIKLYKDNIKFNTLMIYRGDNCDRASIPCVCCTSWLKNIPKLTVAYINLKGEFEYKLASDLVGHQRTFNQLYNTYHCHNL